MKQHADAIVIGAGLAGLVAACELIDAGRRIIILEQEPEQSLGGQAFWSFGGLFLVDSKEQRRLRIRDSRDRAWTDWQNAAGFDRAEDHWPKRWAEAYVDWAASEKRSWLRARGLRFFPIVGWAERRYNSVPRFHVTWGTGPGVIEPFVQRVREAQRRGLAELRFRHQVDAITTTNGVVDGVRGRVLEPSSIARGEPSSRTTVGDFELHAGAVIVTAGGTRESVAGAVVSRIRHARYARASAQHRTRSLVVHPHAEDHRKGIRTVGL
jgi:predicted oxidoreductase